MCNVHDSFWRIYSQHIDVHGTSSRIWMWIRLKSRSMDKMWASWFLSERRSGLVKPGDKLSNQLGESKFLTELGLEIWTRVCRKISIWLAWICSLCRLGYCICDYSKTSRYLWEKVCIGGKPGPLGDCHGNDFTLQYILSCSNCNVHFWCLL